MDAKLAEALTALCAEVTKVLRGLATSDTVAPVSAPAPPSAEMPAAIPVDDRPEWMTVEEFAAAFAVSRGTIYEMIRREELPGRRFGRLVRIHRDALRSDWRKRSHYRER